MQPAYYRWAARKQISFYNNAKTMNGTVTKIQPEKDKGFFTVSIKDTKGRELPYLAKKVVLATGLKDLLPATPGVSENWGKGIYWCPWCDGHEHADQALGLLGPLTSVPSTVREILTLNKNIIAFVNGTDTPAQRAKTEEASPKYLDYLKLHNVRIENRTIAAIERLANVSETAGDPSLPTYPEHDSFLVNFTDGGSTRRDAFFVNFKSEQASTLGAELGIETYGGRLGVDNSKGLVTSVPGVYAIGDCNSDNSTNVPHALYSGKRTAVFLHGKWQSPSFGNCSAAERS